MQLDATTKAAYNAAATPAARAQVVLTALADPVTVTVYDGSDAAMGAGTMATPWATASAGVLTMAEATEFSVDTSGTPDATWYLRLESGAAYLQTTFGLAGSGKEATWSLNEWIAGQTGTIGTGTINAGGGNSAPVFTVAPTTASLPSTGGTIQFTATDPDGTAVVYSLASQYVGGITINATSGLVTVPASAAGTSGNIVVRASDGSLTVDATCAVTVAVGAYKWYPGHYATPDAQMKPVKYAEYDWAIADIAGVPPSKIVGFALTIPWAQVETAKNVYDWSKVRHYRDLIVAQGRRVQLNWAFGCYGYGTSFNLDYFPQYAINESMVAYRYEPGAWDQQFIRVYYPPAMDRMIALYQAMANEFENDPWVVIVGTHETSVPYPTNDSYATNSNTLTQWKRFIDEVRPMFPTTMVAVYNNGFGDHTVTSELSQYIIDNGVGFAGPDCILVPEENGSLIPEFWTELYLRGYRSINGTWTAGQAANQKAKVAYILHQEAIRDESATPALYYNEAHIENASVTQGGYNVTHMVWQMKPSGYVVWPPYPSVPAMNWASVKSYLMSADRPLRSALPTNLGGA